MIDLVNIIIIIMVKVLTVCMRAKPRLANCGISLTMDKDSSEGKPRMDYYLKILLDMYVKRGGIW